MESIISCSNSGLGAHTILIPYAVTSSLLFFPSISNPKSPFRNNSILTTGNSSYFLLPFRNSSIESVLIILSIPIFSTLRIFPLITRSIASKIVLFPASLSPTIMFILSLGINSNCLKRL